MNFPYCQGISGNAWGFWNCLGNCGNSSNAEAFLELPRHFWNCLGISGIA